MTIGASDREARVRIISAQEVTAAERRTYEEGDENQDDEGDLNTICAVAFVASR
jgi:hypothetical protein